MADPETGSQSATVRALGMNVEPDDLRTAQKELSHNWSQLKGQQGSEDRALKARDNLVAYIVKDADVLTCREVFSKGARGFIECPDGVVGQLTFDWLPQDAEWFAVLTSRSILTGPFKDFFVKAIADTFGLSEELGSDFSSVLQELVNNAVIHGNYELALAQSGGFEDLTAFAKKVEQRAEDPAYGLRKVRLAVTEHQSQLVLTCSDDGEGFDAANQPSAGSSKAVSGRGLTIIHELSSNVEVDAEQATVTVNFDLPAAMSSAGLGDREGLHKLVSDAVLSSRIIVADDQEIPLMVMQAYLLNAGYRNVFTASDGSAAWSEMDRILPDIALLDVEMPGASGFEVIERLRQDPRLSDMPVIVISAHDSSEFRNRALSLGATDILTKPVQPELLLHRVRLHLENRHLMNELRSFRLRVREELEVAGRMQADLMPSHQQLQTLCERYGIGAWSFYQTSSELGGDCWGIRQLGDSTFSIYTVDFTGHGVGPAVNTFRLHTLMTDEDLPAHRPDLVLQTLNRRLHSLLPRGQFATIWYGVFDVSHRTLQYAAAGSPPPLFGSWGKKAVVSGESAGLPLGISPDAEYGYIERPIDDGSFLLLFSDAMFETAGKNDAPPMTIDEITATVGDIAVASNAHSPEDPLSGLIQGFFDRSELPLKDDLTAVWISL